MAARNDPTAKALSQVKLFSGLSPKELGVLAGLVRPFKFAAGEEIVREGDEGSRFYLINDGTADVTVRGKVVAQLGPGDHFGEIAVLDRQPRAATVTATTPMTTSSLASFSLRPVLREHPELLEKLLVQVCQQLREAQATSPAA